jgi:hypothetical protein
MGHDHGRFPGRSRASRGALSRIAARPRSGLRMAILPPAVAVALAGGCGTTVDQAGAISRAGVAYTAAVPKAMDEATRIRVEADAVDLVIARETGAAGDRRERREAIAARETALQEGLVIVSRLKQHNAVLQDYFVALGALASSDAAARSAAATDGIVDQLAQLNPAIAQSQVSIAGRTVPVSDFIGKAVELTVRAAQNEALRQELEQHATTIERELELQRAALQALEEQAAANYTTVLEDRRKTLVLDPYLAADSLPPDWVATRADVFLDKEQPLAIAQAQQAADELHAAWIAFAQGEPAGTLLARLRVTLAQLSELLAASGEGGGA